MMMNSELFMGVMMHLISDTVWKSISNDAFRDIMSKIIKEITEECEFGSLKVWAYQQDEFFQQFLLSAGFLQ